MHISPGFIPLLANLNALAGGLFIITTFGIIASRQIGTCLKFFIGQSLFLSLSALLLGLAPFSAHLIAVAFINNATKVWILPRLLKRVVSGEVYTRREIDQSITIPVSLLVAAALTIVAYFIALPWIKTAAVQSAVHINVPVGLAGLLLGGYTLTTRREAIPQLLGLLAMENGAFFAGVAIAPDLPIMAELALAFDILAMTFVVGILTRAVQETIGSTAVGTLDTLREELHK